RARDRGAISARTLRVRDARLPALRMEVQRAQSGVLWRGVALRLQLRGGFPPAHDREGPQPRHRVVLDARWRVACAQGCVRALARAEDLRRARTPEENPARAERQVTRCVIAVILRACESSHAPRPHPEEPEPQARLRASSTRYGEGVSKDGRESESVAMVR